MFSLKFDILDCDFVNKIVSSLFARFLLNILLLFMQSLLMQIMTFLTIEICVYSLLN